jgi:uncharacterized glyoxalase superfamily protein PhnB
MPTILQNHYVLAVPKLRPDVDFFVGVLGFSITAEPPGWAFLKKDNCMVMLGECPDDIPPSEMGSHSYFGYLRVDDVDEYFAEIQKKGVEIMEPVADKPWGMREFALRTPGGHRLKIGQTIQ